MCRHQRSLIGLLLLPLVLLSSLIAFPAGADVGLPPAHPGWSISPGDFTTNVQMVSEEVLIDIYSEPDRAEVDAVFNMQNQGVADEAFDVWFPLAEEIFAGKEDRIFQVDDFRAWVGEDEIEVTIEGLDEEGLVWAHWPVGFPAGEPVLLRVRYVLSPELGHSVGWHHRYEYMLETGAGWLGVIETARITVRSPYNLSEPNRLFHLGDPFFVNPLGYATQGDAIIWTFYDLEPTAEHNIDFFLFDPEIWASVLEAYEDIKTTGGSGESHWELAHGLSLWLTAFTYRPYEFTPSPPAAPDFEAVSQRIVTSYVHSLEAGVLDTSHFRSMIFSLRMLEGYIPPPELDGYFQAALAQRPDELELQEVYEMAINQGFADGIIPPTPTEQPSTPTPTTDATTILSSPPAENSSIYLIVGTVCMLLSGIAFLLYLRSSRGEHVR